jgi:predicted nucleic acid-binding protein
MSRIFLDTSFAIALSTPRDRHHSRALALAGQLEREEAALVTTRAVLLEIGNSLSGKRLRRQGLEMLQYLESDPRAEIVPLSEDLYRRGFELFGQRSDKEWGLIDCISFVVMEERRIRDSLTTDKHFEQAGFRALLRIP